VTFKKLFLATLILVFTLSLVLAPVFINMSWAQDDDLDDLFGDDTGDAGGDDMFGGDDTGGSGDAVGGETAVESPTPDLHEDETMKPYKPLDDSKDPKDPFKPTIEPPMPSIAPTPTINKRTTRREIPPLPIKVDFIVGSDTNRMVLLELNQKPYEMRAGDSEEGGLFKVLEIGEKEVKIFDSRIQKNRVIRLTGN